PHPTSSPHPPVWCGRGCPCFTPPPPPPRDYLQFFLLPPLHRHKAHIGAAHRLTNGLGIIGVILIPLYVGFHILGADEFDLMPGLLQYPCPVMRSRSGFDADQAGRELRHERCHLRAPQPFTQRHLAFSGDAMELEYLFGDIEACDGDLHGNTLLLIVLLYSPHLVPHSGCEGRREESIPLPMEDQCSRGFSTENSGACKSHALETLLCPRASLFKATGCVVRHS